MNPTHALLLRPQSEAFQLTVMEAAVTLGDCLYQVDLGAGVHPRYHAVSAEGVCTCILGEDCPAVSALQRHLAAGGERIPDPPLGYTPVRPKACPICRAKTLHEPLLTSRQRGMGWRCAEGGTAHYWEHRGRVLAEKFALKWKTLGGWSPSSSSSFSSGNG